MKYIQRTFLLFTFTFLLIFSACKKPAGSGGNSSITGKLWVKKFNATSTVVVGEYPGAFEDVYIIYGDDVIYGNKVQTNPDGVYEFKYLRPGSYKVYAYSKDSTGNSNASSKQGIVKNVEITKKKQQVEAETIQIYR